VHGVGVVPEQPEIGCGRAHLHQSADHFPGIGGTGGIGEHRHAPHALDGRVGGDEFLDQVDVGAVLAHRHRDHLDAEALGDREVPVVTRRGAQELDHRLGDPRPWRVDAAVQQREHHRVVHQLQAGVVAGDQVLHRDTEQFAEDRAQLRQPVQPAVVAGVGAVPVAVVVAGQGQQPVGQVELFGRRLAARQVQLELLGLQVGVVAPLQLVLGGQLVAAEGLERHREPFTDEEDQGDPAHPPEPIDPCCLPALGEFTGWTPRGVRSECSTRPPAGGNAVTRAWGRHRLDRSTSAVGYHGPRRIRLVAYGARLERGLG
jgi:hypothetical protein